MCIVLKLVSITQTPEQAEAAARELAAALRAERLAEEGEESDDSEASWDIEWRRPGTSVGCVCVCVCVCARARVAGCSQRPKERTRVFGSLARQFTSSVTN